jgi:2-keto-4-pentenoate hydratase
MSDQLAERDARLAQGDRQIGWKVGFGSPAGLAALGIDRPLVGFLLASGLIPDGASVPVGSYANPMLEPEIAVHLARDVAPGASWHDVKAAIGGLSAAIELADVDPPPADVRTILAGNIFHRHVVLGPVDESRTDGRGISGRVRADGREVAANRRPEGLTGEIVNVVRMTAELLQGCDERLRAGDVVITGSVVPPLPVVPGQHVEAHLGPLGRLSVHVS